MKARWEGLGGVWDGDGEMVNVVRMFCYFLNIRKNISTVGICVHMSSILADYQVTS